MMKILIIALLCLFTSPTQAQVRAGSTQALRERVDELYTTSQKNNQDVATAINLLNQMKAEFVSIKGQLEAAGYLRKENEKVYQDLDMRVSALEDKIGQIHNMMKELKTTTPAPPAAKTAAEYDEFQSLLNLVNAQDFRSAASGFMGFIQKYPQSAYAGSAQFWVADSFYSMGDYVKAIAEFQILTEKYPQHPRVREGIYKQGVAFSRLKKYPEAKLFFQKVMASYPNSAEAAQAKARLHRLESLEGGTLALNLESGPVPTASPRPGTGGTVYNRPVMKPAPMPRSEPPGQPAPANPNPPAAPSEPTTPPPPKDPPAPLF